MERKTTANQPMDILKYNYYPGNNRLKQVQDDVADGSFAGDIDNQANIDNYQYDNIGNLTKDKSEDIENIGCTLYGKLWNISRRIGSDKTNLNFLYDPMGNRVVKLAYNCDLPNDRNKNYSIYARDAQGNIMATYTLKYYNDSNKYILLADGYPIYGSSRLGVLNANTTITKKDNLPDINTTAVFAAVTTAEMTYQPVMMVNGWALPVNPFNPRLTRFKRVLGNKAYELTDHLGNVTVTITDRKIAVKPLNILNPVPAYFAEVKTTQDYYPFGQLIDSRTASAGKYKFGFNGKENLLEVNGWQDYGERMYNRLIGRVPTPDPGSAACIVDGNAFYPEHKQQL